MPTIFIAAAISGAASGVIAGTFAFSWAAFGASLLLGAVSQAMQKKPSSAGSTISSGPSGRLITVRQSIAPWQIIYGQAKVGGCITFFEASADNQYVHLVVTLAGHECEEIGDIYLNDEVVPLDGSGNATGKYAGYVRVHKHLGDPADALQPFASLEAESDGKWTSAHLQRGRAKIYVRLTANPDLFPTGIPNIAAVVKGVNNITDPRDASTGWSDNPVLCLQHYLYDTTFGCGATFPDEFETTTIAAEASICDELVNLAGSPTTTEKRYRLNGAFQTSEKPKAVIEIMLSAMAGKAINVGGLWYIYAGAYSSPTVTLTADDLAGPISVQSHVSRRESANGCKGVFTDPNNAWQATDFPAIASDTYMAEDGGDRVWKDIDLSGFVTSGTQAQRLAKIELLKIRQGLSVTATFKLSAYACVTGRTVAMTFAEFGWTSKAFEVVNTRFTYADDGKLSVELSLRETASAVYDWSTSEEQTVDIAPNTNLPDPSAVGTPSALTFTADDYLIRGEGDLSWTAPSDALTMEYVPEYKLSTATDYNVLSPVTGTTKRITGLQPGTYNFRVKARNYIGAAGSYATLTKTITTPAVGNVSGLELFNDPLSTSFAGQSAKFAWRHSSVLWTEGFGEVSGTGGLEYYWKDYQVEISVSGTVRRIEYVTEGFYTYTYEKNVEDGAGTPARTFTIKVRKRGRYGQLSTIPAQLTVTNPAPTASTPTLTATVKGVTVTFARPTDTDWRGFKFWGSVSSGFTPGSSNLLYDGPDASFAIPALATNVPFYYRYAAVDAFGAGSTSAQQTFLPTALVERNDIETGSATDLASAFSAGVLTYSVGVISPSPATAAFRAPVVQMLALDIDPDNPSKLIAQAQAVWSTNTSVDADMGLYISRFDSKSRYTTGTLSSVSGGPVYYTVTGSGTSWLSAGIGVGDVIYLGLNAGYLIVDSVDSNTQITATAAVDAVLGYTYSGSYTIFIGSAASLDMGLGDYSQMTITTTADLKVPIVLAIQDGPTTSDADYTERVYFQVVRAVNSFFGYYDVSNRSLQLIQSIK